MARNKEIRLDEIDEDYATRFIATKYISEGYGPHFHRNLEIYGVVNGEVSITIAGDKRVLTNGQMAVVNCMEVHEYDINESAEIFYFSMGTTYLSLFVSQYKNNLLPHWLLDAEYNKKIYDEIAPLFENIDDSSELRKFAISATILADIVDRYGVTQGGYDGKSHAFIEQVIQYIYEHYADDITLAFLADKFCIGQSLLSRKLSRCIRMDLRMFVNDIRLQKALQMIEDPAMRDTPVKDIVKQCGFKRTATFYSALKRNDKLYNRDKKLD